MDIFRKKVDGHPKATSASQTNLAKLDVRHRMFPNRAAIRAASMCVISPPPTYHDSQKSLEQEHRPSVTSQSIARSVLRSRSEPNFVDVGMTRRGEGSVNQIYPSLILLEDTIDRLSQDFDPPLSNPSTPRSSAAAYATVNKPKHGSVTFSDGVKALTSDVIASKPSLAVEPSAPAADDVIGPHASVTSLTTRQGSCNDIQKQNAPHSSQNSLQVPPRHRGSVPNGTQVMTSSARNETRHRSLPSIAAGTTTSITVCANNSNAMTAPSMTSRQQSVTAPVRFSIGDGSDMSTNDFESFETLATRAHYSRQLSIPCPGTGRQMNKGNCSTEVPSTFYEDFEFERERHPHSALLHGLVILIVLLILAGIATAAILLTVKYSDDLFGSDTSEKEKLEKLKSSNDPGFSLIYEKTYLDLIYHAALTNQESVSYRDLSVVIIGDLNALADYAEDDWVRYGYLYSTVVKFRQIQNAKGTVAVISITFKKHTPRKAAQSFIKQLEENRNSN